MSNKKKIIVFAPHPDDETFGCGGTIAIKIRNGYEVIIVIMTDGKYAFVKMLGIDTNPTPDKLKEIRKVEVKKAAKILGVQEESLFFLDFEDGTLKENEEEAVKKVTKILRNHTPVEVYYPYEKDSHPDHVATNRIVRKSIKKLGLHTIQYKYSISRKYARVNSIIDFLINLLTNKKVYIDISNVLPIKEAAIKELKSEISIISEKQKRTLLTTLKKFLKNHEVFFVDS
jgi:LmbE family N-acetylglucosaminyl deacetylase